MVTITSGPDDLIAKRLLRPLAVAIAVAGGLVSVPPGRAQADSKRPRPSDVPAAAVTTAMAPSGFQLFNDYATPERVFSSRRSVVHYVSEGIDAPPLNDDDRSGVPDYIEHVGDAADTAIAYYERRGFHAIALDAGGPDPRPDLYVSRFAPGTLGTAIPSTRAQGGAFVAVANNLDPSATTSFCSIYGVVAHELFHLVQFSYFAPEREPMLPAWAAEGSAGAMEGRVYPDLADLVWTLHLRTWLAAPGRPITSQTYGAHLLWRYLDQHDERLLPAYFARLAGRPFAHAGEAALIETYRNVARGSFVATFHRFAVAVADGHEAELRTIRAGRRVRSSVPPLAIHYLRLPPASKRRQTVSIAFPNGRMGADASLVYRVYGETAGVSGGLVRIRPRSANHGHDMTFTVPDRLRRTAASRAPLLVLSNGDANRAAAYVLTES